jgi:hydrogenase expression/formation protein HypD
MKFIDEYRNKEDIALIIDRIRKHSIRQISIMEVCGGHTTAIHKFGLQSMLPENIRLLSGPGCPVCISSQAFIDKAIALSKLNGVIITTYGDLIRVPGSASSLEKERAAGSNIGIVYSVMEAIELAKKNKLNKIIFLGIGFETTAPATAAAILEAKKGKITNFYLFSAHKVMPPVMEALVKDGVKIDGFIAPGHVCAITGTAMYKEFPDKYGLGVVVSGFEPTDILQSIYLLVCQLEARKPLLENEYRRVVKNQGNKVAQQMLAEVFELEDAEWRGLGIVPESGLKLREPFREFDAEARFPIKVPESVEPKGCICGEILKGNKNPSDCPLFSNKCVPSSPIGACMVSSEGTCATWYKYRDHQNG